MAKHDKGQPTYYKLHGSRDLCKSGTRTPRLEKLLDIETPSGALGSGLKPLDSILLQNEHGTSERSLHCKNGSRNACVSHSATRKMNVKALCKVPKGGKQTIQNVASLKT